MYSAPVIAHTLKTIGGSMLGGLGVLSLTNLALGVGLTVLIIRVKRNIDTIEKVVIVRKKYVVEEEDLQNANEKPIE